MIFPAWFHTVTDFAVELIPAAMILGVQLFLTGVIVAVTVPKRFRRW